MNAIEEIDALGGTISLQAGVTLQTLQERAAQQGLFFPLDLAARASATVGGLIAANAGGTRVIRYGMMRELTLGLEAVLSDGTVLSSLNKMLKNNAGYDLKHLFIGSEGTLGVITRAVLRLWPALPSAATALLGLQTFEQVVRLLALSQRMLGGQLTSFEVMWNAYYRLTTTPPAPSAPPLRQDYPLYVLLESLGAEAQQDQERFERLLEAADDQGLFADAVLARSSAQREKLWRVREDFEQIEAQYKPSYGFDISLPIPAMEGYVRRDRGAAAPGIWRDQVLGVRARGRRQPASKFMGRANRRSAARPAQRNHLHPAAKTGRFDLRRTRHRSGEEGLPAAQPHRRGNRRDAAFESRPGPGGDSKPR